MKKFQGKGVYGAIAVGKISLLKKNGRGGKAHSHREYG